MPIPSMICYQEAVGREERLKGEAVSAPPPGCAGYRASKLTESQGLSFFQGHIPHLEFLFAYIFFFVSDEVNERMFFVSLFA